MNRFSKLLFRTCQSPVKKYRTDKYALMAWCLRVMEQSEKHPLEKKYQPGSIKLSDLPKLSYFKNGPLLAKEYLEKHGIQFFVVPHLKKTYLDGAAMVLDKNKPVIALTLRHDRIDNFWFCLLHELVHLKKHLNSHKTDIIVDELNTQKAGAVKKNSKEKQADQIAQNTLIPEKHWRNVDLNAKNLAKEVISLSEKLKIHPAIIAGRIQYEKNNYKILSQFTGRGEVSRLFAL